MAARAARLLARCLKTKGVWLEHARKESSSALLSEHHQMLKKICQDFCDKELKPIAAKCDQEQRFPIEKFRMLSELGLCGVMVPSEYGGSGLDTLSFSIAVEEISRGCASTGLALSVMNAMVNGVIDRFGTVEQKERFLPELAKEGKLACFALSEKEPEVGEAQPTTAHTEGDYYVINGVKSWCSNAADADIVIVFARTEHDGKQGSTAFYVNKSTKGLSVGKCEEMMGLRASSTCNVQFNNVRVHKDDIIGTPGEAFTYARKALNTGKIGVASQSLGISQAALECALEYAGKRHSFDRPIADFQAIQIKFAEMAMRLDAARLMTWQAANLKDAGKRHAKEAAMCKVLASEAATYISHQAIQVLGGMGYVKDMPAERHYRDARITEIYEGTNEINRVLIADRLYSEYQIFD